MASAQYGALLGIAGLVLTKFVPRPVGAIVFWGAFAIQLAVLSRICWRRTGLPFATAAMLQGAVVAACLVVLAFIGQPFPDLPPASWVLFAGGAALGPVFMWVESRVNPEKWAAWARHMEGNSVFDILAARHIPHLTDERDKQCNI